MFFSKDSRLSARVFGPVLNFPLYDADCCPAARDCLAVGNVVSAIAEWQRLADLGSGGARCVLAYLHLMGALSAPIDLEEARRIALSAVGGSRGYANYLLGCISLREKQGSEAVKYFLEAIKAGFMPAATHLASLLIRGPSQDSKQKAATLLRKAVAAGHRPALYRLAVVYLSGQLGFTRRVVGLALLAPAFVRVWLALKYQVFSIQCFQVLAGTTRPLFTEESQRHLEKTNSLAPGAFRRVIVRWVHAIAASTAAMVLVLQSESVPGQTGHTSMLTLGGWALLAAWPYGFSCWLASNLNTRSVISSSVQTILLCSITTLVCSAYAGQLFDSTLSGWEVALLTVAQAFLLLVACGLGEKVADEVDTTDLPASTTRQRIIWVHMILGLIAAGSWFSRSNVWHIDYLRDYGFSLASYVLLAILPYATSAVLSWRIVAANWWRQFAYIGILTLGTALAVANNSATWVLQPGVLGVCLVLMVQFIGFVLAAEWTVEGSGG
jgi:hypothetical protein